MTLLLHGLDRDLDRDVVSDLADLLERLVERHAEVLTVDRAGGEERGPHLAPGVLEPALVGALEDHGLRLVADREVADEADGLALHSDTGAAEGHGGEALDREEVRS